MSCFLKAKSENQRYRIYLPHVKEDLQNPCILFWYKRHPIREFGEGVTFTKHKISLLESAGKMVKLDCCAMLDEAIGTEENNHLEIFPSDLWIYQISAYLGAEDILCFAQTCRLARTIFLGNIVWKKLCYRTFSNPGILTLDVNRLPYLFHILPSRTTDMESLRESYTRSYWRLVFVVLYQLETMPSVVHPSSPNPSRYISECTSNSTSSFRLTSTKGELEFSGVREATCAEYLVYNYEIRSGHRRYFKEIQPCDTKSTLAELGLKITRTRRKSGSVPRRGLFLHTDIGERVNINRRRLPSLKFRAFKLRGRCLLLCHDVVYRDRKYSNVFNLLQITLLWDEHSL